MTPGHHFNTNEYEMGAEKLPKDRFSKLVQTKVTGSAFRKLQARIRKSAMTQSAYLRRLIQMDINSKPGE